MRASGDFTHAVRSGVRAGRQTLVVHLSNTHPEPRVGFVVSKQVGNAVTRNRVKRKLRHLMAQRVRELDGVHVVVRALPAAATSSSATLASDLDSALLTGLKRLTGKEATA